jgi:hypothetical protein
VDSLRHNTKYADELNKYRDLTTAYGANDQAMNLRTGVKAATGYKIDQDNPIGNMTPVDVAGTAAQAPVDAWLALKGAAGAKGKIGKFIRGGAAMSAPGVALGQVGEPKQEGMGFLGEKNVDEAGSAAQQAAIAIAMKKAHKKPQTK